MDILAPITSHWFLFLLFAVLILGMIGVLGRGLGLHNVFHEDPELARLYRARDGSRIYWNSPAIFGQAAIIAFVALIWGFAYALGDGTASGPSEIASMGTRVALQTLISAPLSLAAGMLRISDVTGKPQPGERWRCLLGALLGVVVGLAVLGAGLAVQEGILGLFPNAARWAPTVGMALPALGVVAVVLGYRKLLPVMALVSLFALIAILYALVAVAPDRWQLPLVVAGAFVVVWANGLAARILGFGAPFKFEIPGLVGAGGASLYARGKQIDIFGGDQQPTSGVAPLEALRAWTARAKAAQMSTEAKVEKAARKGKVDPLRVLEAWRERVGGRGPGNPKLVLLATSGGAYRASFWTALVLDRLFERDDTDDLAGFRDNIRLITGASGGMVGGAYFAARANEKGIKPDSIVAALERDVLAAQDREVPSDYLYKTRYPIPRDSLSAVAQQLVQRDVPGLLWPNRQVTDRGIVLEDQWLTLDLSFESMKEGEAEGWRPSIVFSPMLVETGQPLLIGNLDMDLIREDRYGETVEFFDWFPDSRKNFKVKTAVRLNASFPYVSPVCALPTRPYRRVVDAGYYDNYGVDLAVAYLSQPRLMGWITAHCSGVVLIEMRAFPFPLPDPKPPGPVARAFQWLTTPLEGLLVARGSTMRFRNRQSFGRLKDAYADKAGEGFLTNVVFEVDSQSSMNWYLPGRELDYMRSALDYDVNVEAERRLLDFWRR